MEEAGGFDTAFHNVTDQNVQDWSAWEELKDKGKTNDPIAIGKCIDSCIVGEITRIVEQGNFQASYLQQLATLLCDLRKAML